MASQQITALTDELERKLSSRPFSLEFWDGTRLSATTGNGPVFYVHSPLAIAHLMLAPSELGLARAYVSGALSVDDLGSVLEISDGEWGPPKLGPGDLGRLLFLAGRVTGVRRPPRAPKAELAPRGRLHSKERDARAVRHHYDVSNRFFSLFLDESMTYSCGFFSSGAQTLEEAQRVKLDLVCQKLGLGEGYRVLDVGCGWGSFAIHAAANYGASVLGITLSEPQAELARERVKAAGVSDRVEIRVADYRDLGSESFDAIASIGMVEHVGGQQIDDYASALARVLRPGGSLLNHGISRLPAGPYEPTSFTKRYVFPDGDPLRLSYVLGALERAGFESLHSEGFRRDYSETLAHWIRRLESRIDEAMQIAGPQRVRVWQLYLRGAKRGFDIGLTSIYQTLLVKPAPHQMPPGPPFAHLAYSQTQADGDGAVTRTKTPSK
jgi:cyclopropane-fatty-acyl-phospholipid synthase